MKPSFLPDHLSPLVDRLRSGNHPPVSLPDVAALTEVLMRSLESYMSSIDLTVYRECQSLADYINEARDEIASLSANSEDSDVEIPKAGQELEAIVIETEEATNTIMTAAEDIMGADPDDTEAYQACVNDAVMKIFEACSFQDITGQRISKVVRTLQQVESRIDSLINIMGIEESSVEKETNNGEIDEKDLLNGPALAGEAIEQSEIDSILSGNPVSDSQTIPEEKNAPVAEDESPVPVAAKEPDVKAEAPKVGEAPKTEEAAKQDNIDAMFDAPAVAAPADPTPSENTSSAPEKPKLVKSTKPVGDIQTPKNAEGETTSQDDIDALFN